MRNLSLKERKRKKSNILKLKEKPNLDPTILNENNLLTSVVCEVPQSPFKMLMTYLKNGLNHQEATL